MISKRDKGIVWLSGSIKTPPFSQTARMEAGYLLRRLQSGVKLSLPHSRPMPSIGPRCHELRINDQASTWRILYRVDRDTILVLAIFAKQSQQTPKPIIAACQKRLRDYDQ
jgi:phage-related protein